MIPGATVASKQLVKKTRPQIGGGLTCVKLDGESTGDGGDQYTGLDRFGRVIDQRWVNSSGGAVDRYTYTYDRDGNRLGRSNLTKLDGSPDETYGYDSLNRLIDANRGGSDYQSWILDALGNMSSVTTGQDEVERTHNAANEITSIEGSTGSITYDANETEIVQGRAFWFPVWAGFVRTVVLREES